MRSLFPLAVLAVVLLEIVLLVQVSSLLGGLATFAIVLATGLLGGALMRREGRRTWDELRTAVQQNRTPDRDLANTALVLFGGALLVVPGFVTDVIGLLLVLPFTRPPARALMRRVLARRVPDVGRAGWIPGPAGAGSGSTAEGGPVVIQGEVIEESGDAAESSVTGEGDVERKQ